MDRSFPLLIKVINGEIQDSPVQFYFRCNQLKPRGPDVLRYFDENMCSLAMKIFYLEYNGELFGSTQFKTLNDFWQYWNAQCISNRTYLLLNGCRMLINGKPVSI